MTGNHGPALIFPFRAPPPAFASSTHRALIRPPNDCTIHLGSHAALSHVQLSSCSPSLLPFTFIPVITSIAHTYTLRCSSPCSQRCDPTASHRHLSVPTCPPHC